MRHPTTPPSSRPAALLLALALAIAPSWAAADQAAESALGARVAALGGAVEGSALADEAKAAVGAQLQRATEDLAAAGEAREAARTLAAEAARAPGEVARIEAGRAEDIDRAFAAWQRTLPAESAPALEARLGEARAELDRLRQDYASTSAQLAASLSRPAELIEAAVNERSRLADLERAADTARAAAAPGAGLEAEARALGAQAAVLRSAAELERLDEERTALPALQRLYEASRRDIERRIVLAERKLGALATRVAERRIAEAEAERDRVGAEIDALGDIPTAPLAALAQRTRDYAGRRVGAAGDAAEAQAGSEEAARAASLANRSLRNTQTRLALGGGGQALGLVLLQERRQLAEPKALRAEIDRVRRRLVDLQLSQIALDEQRDWLEDRSDALEDLEESGAEAGATNAEDQAALHALTLDLVSTQARLLPQLQEAERRLVMALSQYEKDLLSQLAATEALEALLERRLLWMRSHPPVDAAWLASQPAGLADLLKPERYLTAARLTWEAAHREWPTTLALALALLASLGLRRRLAQRSEALAPTLRRVRSDRFTHTLEIAALTLAAALPLPLLAFGLGWLLQHAGEPGKFSDSLGGAVTALVPLLLVAGLCGRLAQERGLALHLRWTSARRDWLRRLEPWLVVVVAPLQLVATLAFARNQEPALATVGRDAMVLWCLALAVAAWAALRPGALWSPRGGVAEPVRLRQATRVLATLALLVLAGLALGGFLLTTLTFGATIIATMLAMLCIGLAHGLLARWFLLGERRLALRRLEQRQEALAADEGGEEDASGEAVPEPDADSLDREAINLQTRRLLRALTLGAVVLALLLTWSPLLPALQRLDEVVLWMVEGTGADGLPGVEAVTLADLVGGLALLALTVIAARNLPGLLELALLSRIHIDAPTRYAISSLSRYVIVIGGVIGGLALMGVRWGQLQWMAAALTVGLGFGLQEIFANFVSGIIVLFERPYRVGDVVTIGEVEGTVTKIRTRATTILDWDNKDVVVPNRMFITERFVNWTLSDAVTRVVVPVGVAYGSDADRVRELLLQVAREEPMVIANPPPTAWFMAFGPSSLDFELRVFVGQILDRNRARTAMMTRIAAVFREEGIEIAFPQLDLNLKGGESLKALAEAAGAEGGTTIRT